MVDPCISKVLVALKTTAVFNLYLSYMRTSVFYYSFYEYGLFR